MQAACEAGDAFAWLEGGGGGDALGALYAAVREPWLVRALLLYHARTGSQRALALLARAPEHHARLALDALAEQLRGERAARHHALAALAPLVARRPPWLHLLLPPNALARDLLRAARCEREPVPLLHALLALAALLPAAPALAAALAPELAEALARAPAPEASAPARAALALGARALFLAAYATHPCTLLDAMRASGAELAGAAREAWERGVAALARGVALHPALVTGSRRAEADGGRWARAQPHDVLAECGRLALPARDAPPPEPTSPAPASPAAGPAPPSPAPLPGSGAQAALAAGALRPGGAGWFALGERSGAEAAPHTPLPGAGAGAEPEPEPAVEATPENTPARLARQAFRFPPADSPAVRPLGRTPPAPDACAARLQRVQAERRAQDSPVPIGGAPPSQAARPEPQHPSAPDREDREVRELTARALAAAAAGAWAEAEAGPGAAPGPGPGAGGEARALARPLPRGPRAPAPRPARRAASCGPAPAAARRDCAAQTVDTWPEPYEFLLEDFFAALPDDDAAPDKVQQKSTQLAEPAERLDRYLAALYAGGRKGAPAGPQAELAEQLALAHAQLMYERWRRDAHAERNRRLLGRCRAVRALELANAALRDRVRDLTAERDAMRERAAPPAPAPAPAPAAPAPGDAPAERELAQERAARLRAEAALREAEAGRARDAAELQRTRGESFEAARHVEALARAALAAERRAEHVRRLRRELLLLGEREARLADAVRAALQAPAPAAADGAERALRAACARAEAEAEAAGARAEAAVARAHELEAALASREAALSELKRAARGEAEESAARQRALRDKYAALQRVVRAADARELERRAAAPTDRLRLGATE